MVRSRPVTWCRHGLAAALVLGAAVPTGAAAQGPERVLRVYLDCQTWGCDFDHFRREITFATWVRNREDAQVHLLVTGRGTGGGGREFTLTFFGREQFAGRQDTLRLTTDQTQTDAEVRDGLTRVISLGLVSYAARNGGTPRLRVVPLVVNEPMEDVAPRRHGGWDYWVFRIRGGGFVSGESQQSSVSVDGGVSASRVTEALKLRFGLSGRYTRDGYDVDEIDAGTGDTVTTTDIYIRKNWNSYALAGWTVGRHWAAGVRGDVGASTYFNQDLYFSGGPIAEYNVFPYEESTRRILAATLTVGATGARYADTTIFGKTRELHAAHSLELQFSQQQPWGSVHTNVEWVQYWHDLGVHLLELFAGAEVRIVKGLALNTSGSFARVRDQLYLPAAGLSEQEILTRQRARGTDFRFRVNFGLSFTFGATDNSIVNPRLDL